MIRRGQMRVYEKLQESQLGSRRGVQDYSEEMAGLNGRFQMALFEY